MMAPVISVGPTETIALAILSGMLIAFGLMVVLRDRQPPGSFMRRDMPPDAAQTDGDLAAVDIVAGAGDRAASIPAVPRAHHPDIAASVITTAPGPPMQSFTPMGNPTTPALDELRNSLATIRHETLDDLPEGPRLPWVEQRWAEMQPVIASAVETINATVAKIGITIGGPGEPNWSFKNRGFGTYRRILSDQQSLAWLRLELAPEGRLVCKVRAHRDDQAVLNCRVEAPSATLTEKAATDALARCVKPVSEYVAWRVPQDSHAEPSMPHAASAYTQQSDHATNHVAGGLQWSDVAQMAEAALLVVNGALIPADARLTVLADPARDAGLDRDRWPLAIEVNGRTIALMHIDRTGEMIDVAVGVADRNRLDLARFRQAQIGGLTAQSLAEMMASCAWPSIADAHGPARQAS
jgi:hypothetical protein